MFEELYVAVPCPKCKKDFPLQEPTRDILLRRATEVQLEMECPNHTSPEWDEPSTQL